MKWVAAVKRSFTPDQFDIYVQSLKLSAWRPSFVVLHNTGVPHLYDWYNYSGKQRMNGLEHYYRDVMNWHAGPHLFVADDLIWVFTPLTVCGVHSPSWNAVSWGVEMVGDYNTEAFDPRVKSNTVAALASLHVKAGLFSSSLRLHKEDPATTHKSCPGVHVDKAEIMREVHALILKRHPGEH